MSLVAQGIELPGRILLDELHIKKGSCTVVCGPNGSGKSSLLRVLSGVDLSPAGRVFIEEKDVALMSPLERAAYIAWLPQRSTIFSAWTVEALVACCRYRFSESQALALEQAVKLLHEHGLEHLIGRLSSEISGGELQRVLIVSLVAQQAQFLMLDEPANHLDPKHQINAYQTLGKLWHKGHGLIIVSHDIRLAQLLGDADQIQIVGIKDGRLNFQMAFSDPKLERALSQLYDVPFVPRDLPGALAVHLRAGALAELNKQTGQSE